MEQYSGNSNTTKNKMVKKEVKPVVKGKTTAVKQKTSFLSTSLSNIKEYTIADVVMPAIKKGIYDIVTNAMDVIFYNGERRSKEHRRGRPNYTSYNTMYDDDRRPVKSRSRAFSFDEVLYDFRDDAEEVLDEMKNLIEQFGVVSVADFYELSNYNSDNFTDHKHGWFDVDTASIYRVENRWALKLPKVKQIN